MYHFLLGYFPTLKIPQEYVPIIVQSHLGLWSVHIGFSFLCFYTEMFMLLYQKHKVHHKTSER